ncbi:DUF3795 domain-containing protein [Dehalococcoides mccartyi]|uniref:DUF3795 domain-containing protein n=1 Tax=Dehalococcoides mccartyi (strain VS) TaxID=311424 RepID=D2BIA8_DEHMV|nr:DUF3795 domain-containing protein [Dehalococcoides mccartyi]ACZ62058.1 hypothetical protein DhcVS_939 [Dehalococcoides mccartyi VS]
MEMPETSAPEIIAPCGINCLGCRAYLMQKKVCSGCFTDSRTKSDSCRNCRIKACAAEHEVNACAACGVFPCRLIVNIDKRYRLRYGLSLIENGLFLKQNGFEVFFAREKERLSCPECGGIICIHNRTCSTCLKTYPIDNSSR